MNNRKQVLAIAHQGAPYACASCVRAGALWRALSRVRGHALFAPTESVTYDAPRPSKLAHSHAPLSNPPTGAAAAAFGVLGLPKVWPRFCISGAGFERVMEEASVAVLVGAEGCVC